MLRRLGFDLRKTGTELQHRNEPWSRDELILALELYLTNPASPPGKSSKEVRELSSLLNRLAEQLNRGGTHATTYRNANGVYMKMMNFRRFDPAFTASGKVGLTRGNKDEAIVWNEFSADGQKLGQVATAILECTPSGGHRSGRQIDHPPGVLLFELGRAPVSKRGMEPLAVVDLIDEARQ
jgi:predicted HNH restriction endonuclease